MYKKIVDIGVLEKYSDTKNKQIYLLNTYALITIHFTFIMPVGDFITGILNDKILYSYLFIFLNMIFVLVLNKLEKHKIARLLWMFVILINIFLFSTVIMPGSYNEYYYAFLSGIALSLYKKHTIPILFTILSFCLFFVPYYGIVSYSKEVVSKLDISAVVGLFLCFYFLVNYFRKNNIESERKLLEALKKLEESKKRELVQLELKSLKTQINPHFIFNSVNAIQGLVLKGDKHDAYQYLSKFSKIIRDSVNANSKDYVKLDQEVTLLQKYLELEKLRFQNMFEYHLIVAPDIGTVFIPSTVIQTFVDDIVLRVFHTPKSLKKISIQVRKESEVCVDVINNGISVKSYKELINESDLIISKESIAQIINIFNKSYQLKIKYTISQEGEETITKIKIPYLTKL